MAVGVQSDAHSGVPQPLGNDLGAHPVLKHEGGLWAMCPHALRRLKGLMGDPRGVAKTSPLSW